MDPGKRGEYAQLFAVVLFGLLLKLFAGRNFLTENGVLFPGYDEYYHMRRILFTASHFPNTLWFDSYLNYPEGWDITWPPLFDQISAVFCIALGQHTKEGMEIAASLVPILIGIIALVAVYYTVRELFDHKVALLASFMAALTPYYLHYTRFAAMDHHGLEVLFVLIILLFITMAICRKEKRYLFACLAGGAMASLAYTWQGASIYLGIFLLYAAVKISLSLKEGKSSKEIATTLLIAFAIALIIVLPFWNSSWLYFSFLGITGMIVALCIMFAIAHSIEKMNLSWKAFPLSILILSLLFALLAQLSAGSFGLSAIVSYGFDYIWGGGMIGKVAEADPLIYDTKTFSLVAFSLLGLNILLSLGGIAAFVMDIIRSNGAKREGKILLLVWALSTLILTFGQNRFLYISTIAIGIMISILFFYVLDLADNRIKKSGQRTLRILAAVLLLLLILPTAWQATSYVLNPSSEVAGDWQESLAWLKENSNTTSFFASPQKTPEYSVMSWWDYGNWILYLSERPVVANNFQAGAEDAAKFYLSQSEPEAMAVLDARGSRYVIVDNDLTYGKLASLTRWSNEDIDSYRKIEKNGSRSIVQSLGRYNNSTLARLYFFDGSDMDHFRLIYESKTSYGERPAKSKVKIFEYVPGALIKVRAGPDQRVVALLNMTSNQGRRFIYVNEAEPKGDSFEVKVPYSTESRYGCRAIDPYLVLSGDKYSVKTTNLNVSEEDIINGRTIELKF
jgi:dolichyl-diphosphooligosaccharide--protein glycosyltransferase